MLKNLYCELKMLRKNFDIEIQLKELREERSELIKEQWEMRIKLKIPKTISNKRKLRTEVLLLREKSLELTKEIRKLNKKRRSFKKEINEITEISLEKSIVERNKIYFSILKKYKVKELLCNNLDRSQSGIITVSYVVILTKAINSRVLIYYGFTLVRNTFMKKTEKISYSIRKKRVKIICSYNDLDEAKRNISGLVPSIWDGKFVNIVYMYNFPSNLFFLNKLLECKLSELGNLIKDLFECCSECKVVDKIGAIQIVKKGFRFSFFGFFNPKIPEFYKLITCGIKNFEDLEEAKKIIDKFINKLKFYKILPHYYDCKIICF